MKEHFEYFNSLKGQVDKQATSVLAFAWRRHRVSVKVKQREAERLEKERIAEANMIAK